MHAPARPPAIALLLALLGGQAVAGWACALFPDLALLAPYNRAVHQAFWQQDGVPAQLVAYRQWIWAVMGATLAAWSVACMWLAHVPLRRGETWAGWAIASSLLAWFPFDTGMSAALGNWPNVWLNCGSVAATGAALWWAWPRRIAQS